MSIRDATLGRPSYWWRLGQERRLNMILDHFDLNNKRILDIGCGVGMYLLAFKRFSAQIFGIDVELGRLLIAHDSIPNILLSLGEHLPFQNHSFDMVFLNEVIEHVQNDRETIVESVRVISPGGHLVIFAPNRLYPFETHGIYWKGKYKFGNIPFIGYLPDQMRNKVAYHVRAYRKNDILKLFEDLPLRIVEFTQIYPGFDKMMTSSAVTSTLFRKTFYALEKTPLKVFGLSHFIIARF